MSDWKITKKAEDINRATVTFQVSSAQLTKDIEITKAAMEQMGKKMREAITAEVKKACEQAKVNPPAHAPDSLHYGGSGAIGLWQFIRPTTPVTPARARGLQQLAAMFTARMRSERVLEARARRHARDDPVIAELWRRHDERGGYTCTLEELDEIIAEVG